MLIQRYIDIDKSLTPGKVLVLLGPRRSGKTTLLNSFLDSTTKSTVFYMGDELSVQNNFSQADSNILSPLIGTSDVLVIDEAQMIPNIGSVLKLIVDSNPKLSIVVTGSSAFELAGQVGEPLTGRKRTQYLLPISVDEYSKTSTTPQHFITENLHELLIYGMYPNVLNTVDNTEKVEFLRELVDSYLLKDVLAFQEVKGSAVLLKLLNLLAYQIGNLVSLKEIGASLGLDRKTVERYIDILEKAYIIFRVGGYSRNLRSEITKMSKYYFYDNGVRNALINNHNVLDIRNDVGQLWENFVISERLKTRNYYGPRANQYFWRTYKGSEIDLIEERDGCLYSYEVKWSSKKKPENAPKEWVDSYNEQSSWKIINPDNFYSFVKDDR